ncbi:MAG: transcription antitermination factor NusB [Desulfuromonadales bacterium]|nr:transcription antitermination factor NusB [Desulfuromonadales bacterium]NIS40262.1 transcription antitermination factor NusB [Desulfuromonadales bacterium]
MKGVRRKGREIALKMLYSLQTPVTDIHAVLDDFWANFRFRDDVLGEALDDADLPVPAEVRRFAEQIVVDIADKREDVDAAISRHARNWTLDRMARVDLAILRLASYELLYCPETPASVVLNEAVELAKRFGTKESPSFVNGILDKVARVRSERSK